MSESNMSELIVVRFTLNGREVAVATPPMQRLLDLLRDSFGLMGAKLGCGEGDCGACTVLLDGVAVVACLVPAAQVEGAQIRTVESLAEAPDLHPLQQAFLEQGGTQCGMCAPGFLMAACSHLENGGATDDASLREALSGVLCRCTGYHRVIESVQRASAGGRSDAPDHL